jgi:hypothetical protein
MKTGFLRLFLVILSSVTATTVFTLLFAIENEAKIYLAGKMSCLKRIFEISRFNK